MKWLKFTILVIILSFLFTEKIICEEVYIYGYVSYYAEEFAGRKTSSGAIFDPNKYTAASRTLPFGTILEVMNTRTGKSVLVMVNDRGPFKEGRILDLSRKAAEEIDMIREGVGFCKIKIVQLGDGTFSEEKYNKMIGLQKSSEVTYEFAIQVGAFTNKQRALDIQKKLEQDGFQNVYITQKLIDNVIFNRVRIGDFSSQEEAIKIKEILKSKGYDTYMVSTYVEK